MKDRKSQRWLYVLGLISILTLVLVVPGRAQSTPIEIPEERIGPANQPLQNPPSVTPEETEADVYLSLGLAKEQIKPGENVELEITLTNTSGAEAGQHHLYIHVGDQLAIETTPTLAYDPAHNIYTTTLASLAGDGTQSITLLLESNETANGVQTITVFGQDTIYKYPQRQAVDHLLIGSGSTAMLESTTQEEYPGWQPTFLEPTTSLFSGASAFSYPFEVPPGRNGLQPNLGLSYNSRQTDTKVGWSYSGDIAEGWSLNGIPSIVRNDVTYCWPQNYQWILVKNDFSLILNGATYDLVETTPNQNYGQYEAEGEPSLYVERRNDIIPGNGSSANVTGEYWIVRTPDGTEYQFGYTADAEQIIYRTVGVNTPGGGDGQGCGNDPYIGRHKNTSVYRWWLNKTTDSHDNQLTVDYLQEDILLAEFGDGCGEGICREIAAYPANIWYNNTTPGNWASHIQFNYEDYGIIQRVNGGFPMFETAKGLTDIDMRQNTPTGWQTVWSYHLDHTDYTGATTPPINHGMPRPIRALESITQKDAQDNTTLPPTTFSYELRETSQQDVFCGPPNWICNVIFKYPYLKSVDNGYGGIHEFTYSNRIDAIPGNERYNYRVTELHSWDGVETIYGTTDPTRRREYGATHGNAEFEEAKLIGFPKVTVHTYAGGTNTPPLHISETEFHTTGDLWQGKQEYVRTLSPTPGNAERPINQTFYDWTNVEADCPKTGLEQDEFVCLRETVTTQYYYPSSGGDVSTSTTTRNHYEPGSQGNRQWGFVTRQDFSYKGPFDASDVTYQHNTTAYATNTTGDNWLALPWGKGTFKGNDWDTILTFNLFLYDGQTDPDNQTVTNGHLTMSRSLLTDNDLDPTASGLRFKTVDATFTYDPYGNVETTSTYADYGEVTGVQGVDWAPGTAAGNNSTAYTSTNQYTNYGLQVASISTAPIVHQTTYNTYHGRFTWLPTQITDANGLATHLAYDDSMRLTKIASPGDDINSNPTTEYVYDLSSTPIRIDAIIQPNDINLRQETSQYYNGLGQVLQTSSRDHAVAGQGQRDLISTVSFDALGRPVCQSTPFTASLNSGYQGVSACSVTHSATVYDTERGGVEKSIAPDGSETTRYFSMPGWVAASTGEGAYLEQFSNPDGDWTTHTYNALGQLISVGQFIYDTPCNELQLTEYEYDGNNNLASVTRNGRLCGTTYENPDPVTTNMSYDALGRKLSMTDPDMGVWTYEYDPSSNITRQTDGNGEVICSYYDSFNRITRKVRDGIPGDDCPTQPPTANGNHLATYTYDSQANGVGQIATISWGADPTEDNDTFSYDSLGRLASHTRLINNQAFTLNTLSHDILHRPLDLQYPDGEIVTLNYDGEGADTLTAGTDNLVTGLTYNERGQVVARTLGNGLTTNYGYYTATGPDGNSNFRLSDITLNNGSQELLQFEYAYDVLGNITRMVSTENGQTGQLDIQDFSYDDLGRLKTATGGGGWLNAYTYDYDYDRLGNLIERGSTTYNYTVGDQPHAVKSLSDGSTFTYDDNGNMETRRGSTGDFDQVFDVENRLISVTDLATGKVTGFEYDASGQRVLTVEPDGTNIYTPFPNYQETHVPESTGGGVGFGTDSVQGNVNRRSTYLFNGQAVAQRQHAATYVDTFEDQLAQGWTPSTVNNGWSVTLNAANDRVYRQGWSQGERTSSYALAQSGAMSFEWDMEYTFGQNKAGFLFFADTTTGGNAYRVWQRGDLLRLQKLTGGTPATVATNYTATASQDVVYAYRVTYDPTTGVIQVYRDNELMITWIDGAPLTSGSYLVLRTNNSQVEFDDVQANEMTLNFLHGDHLGSNSLMTDATGSVVSGSQSAFLPFGDWRNEPNTAELTDLGYTGHQHNNTATNDLGLIYMNARYYIPGLAKFASADTLVPAPLNPQSHNRFSYVLNNPLRLIDPSGHCAGTPDNPPDAEAEACWDYLENDFCQVVDCNGETWKFWLDHTNIFGIISFANDWKKSELETLANAINAVLQALNNIGIDWLDTPLAQFDFKKGNYNMTLVRTITLINVDEQTIWHEMGHAIDAGLGTDLHDRFDAKSGNCFIFCKEHAQQGYCYREYGCSADNHGGFGIFDPVYGLFARQGETWADAFAAWVYNETYGTNPDTWIRDSKTPQWSDIYDTVEDVLDDEF